MNRRLYACLLAVAMLLSLPNPAGATGLHAERSEETEVRLGEPVSEEWEADDTDDTSEDAEAVLEAEDAEAILMAASGTCGDEVNWTLDNNGALVISGTGKMYDYSTSNPPPWNANKESIKTLEIQQGVTSVGNSAFNGCTKLVAANLKSDLSTIGTNAFNNCSALASVDLPLKLTSIGSYAFNGCSSLRDVFYGAKYGTGYYSSDYKWSSITIGAHNEPLKTATLHGQGVTAVESGTCGSQVYWMLDSSKLLVVSGSGAMKFDDNVAPWSGNVSKINTVIIKEGITQVADSAFDSCTYLYRLTLPASLTAIQDYAVYNCKNLTTLDYAGSYEDWGKITIGTEGNDALLTASIYYQGSETGLVASGTCGTDARWTLDVNGTLTISGSGIVNKRPYRNDISSKVLSVKIEEGITALKATGGISYYYGSGRRVDLFYELTSMKEISIPGSVT